MHPSFHAEYTTALDEYKAGLRRIFQEVFDYVDKDEISVAGKMRLYNLIFDYVSANDDFLETNVNLRTSLQSIKNTENGFDTRSYTNWKTKAILDELENHLHETREKREQWTERQPKIYRQTLEYIKKYFYSKQLDERLLMPVKDRKLQYQELDHFFAEFLVFHTAKMRGFGAT